MQLSHLEKTFLNQRQLTQFRDYELNSAQLNIGYRVLPKTSWVLDLGLSETNYQYQHVGLLSLNNRVSSVLTGVIWEVTGKTTGRAKFGLEKRDFSDNQRKGDTSVAWDIGADWHLRSYSRLSISTGAKTQEPEAQGDYMETKDVALSWQHQWRQRLKTTLSFNMENEMYHGVEREQRIYNSAFIMGYDFNRWLHVDNELRHTQQDSTEMNYQYDKNLILLTLTATL